MRGSHDHKARVVDAATLALEATRYLEAIEFFRALELDVRWRPEAEELAMSGHAPAIGHPACERCARPLVRINGLHVCLQPSNELGRSG